MSCAIASPHGTVSGIEYGVIARLAQHKREFGRLLALLFGRMGVNGHIGVVRSFRWACPDKRLFLARSSDAVRPLL